MTRQMVVACVLMCLSGCIQKEPLSVEPVESSNPFVQQFELSGGVSTQLGDGIDFGYSNLNRFAIDGPVAAAPIFVLRDINTGDTFNTRFYDLNVVVFEMEGSTWQLKESIDVIGRPSGYNHGEDVTLAIRQEGPSVLVRTVEPTILETQQLGVAATEADPGGADQMHFYAGEDLRYQSTLSLAEAALDVRDIEGGFRSDDNRLFAWHDAIVPAHFSDDGSYLYVDNRQENGDPPRPTADELNFTVGELLEPPAGSTIRGFPAYSGDKVAVFVETGDVVQLRVFKRSENDASQFVDWASLLVDPSEPLEFDTGDNPLFADYAEETFPYAVFNATDDSELAIVDTDGVIVHRFDFDGSLLSLEELDRPAELEGQPLVVMAPQSIEFDGDRLRLIRRVPGDTSSSPAFHGLGVPVAEVLVDWRRSADWETATERVLETGIFELDFGMPGAPDVRLATHGPLMLSGDWALVSRYEPLTFIYVGPPSLSVAVPANGGRVVSIDSGDNELDVANIDCPGACVADTDPVRDGIQSLADGTRVTLNPEPVDGFEFVQFTGDQCQTNAGLASFPNAILVTVTGQPVICGAEFRSLVPNEDAFVRLGMQGRQAGDRIESNVSLFCTDPDAPASDSNICSGDFPVGENIILTALPAERLREWVNCPNSDGNQCQFTVPVNGLAVDAIFGEPPNDFAPVLPDANFTADINDPVGTIIGQLIATDADPRAIFTYRALGPIQPFGLDASTGEVSSIDTLTVGQTAFQAEVFDGLFTSPPATVTIDVSDRTAVGFTTKTLVDLIDEGQFVKMIIDDSGLPLMATYAPDGVVGRVRFIRCQDIDCNTLAANNVIASGPGATTGQYLDLKLRSGLPIVSYYEEQSDTVKMVYCNNVDCTDASNPFLSTENQGGIFTSIGGFVLGGQFPRVGFVREFNGNGQLTIGGCNRTTCTGTDPSTFISLLDESGNNVLANNASMILDTAGNALFAYQTRSGNAVNYLKCDTLNCSLVTENVIESAPSGQFVGNDISIKLRNDLPVVTYRNSNQGVARIVFCSDTVCLNSTSQTFSLPNEAIGQGLSVDFKSDGSPVLSFWTNDGAARLILAICDDAQCSNWSSVEIDQVNGFGFYSSVAVVNDIPVVAYHDPQAQSLKYARCTNSECSN